MYDLYQKLLLLQCSRAWNEVPTGTWNRTCQASEKCRRECPAALNVLFCFTTLNLTRSSTGCPRFAQRTVLQVHTFVCWQCYAALQVIQLAFIVACMYTGVGLLRLGFMVRFLSHSVITGFTSGG